MQGLRPLLLCALLSGCNLAPRYQRHTEFMPESYRMEEEVSAQEDTQWWEAFGDPVLTELIHRALHNNRDLLLASARVEQYYGQYMIARAPLFPEIDLKGDAFRQRFSKDSALSIPGSGPVFSDFGSTVTFSYELDFWGQLRNTRNVGMQEYLSQIQNRKTVILALVGSVAQSYIYLLQLDLQMEISQATLETRRDSLRIARARFEGGLTSEIEVAQAQSLFEEALRAVKELERKIPCQENLISLLLGESSTSISRGKKLQEMSLFSVAAGLPSHLLTQRPDILQAEHQLIGSGAQIGIARAAFFPGINLLGFYGIDTQQLKSFFSLPAQTWQFGGALFQTIFAGGKLIGNLKAAKAQQTQALMNYEQKILNALKEVNDALVRHKKAKEIVFVEKADVEALEEYVNLSWLRYYEGENQYLTVLDAERSLFSGEITLAEALGDQFLTLVELYKALGGGWVDTADTLSLEKCTP